MARFLSSTDVAIAMAIKAGSLELAEAVSRFGGTYVAISDKFGLIEVADSMAAAQERVAEIKRRLES